MGLLIGGSAITVVEFLDLVAYTVMRKCDEKRRAKRQTRPIGGDVDANKGKSAPGPETLTSVENNEQDLHFTYNDDYKLT